MDVTGIVAMAGLAVLVILAGRVGAVCGRARARAAANRRGRSVGRDTPARSTSTRPLVDEAPTRRG